MSDTKQILVVDDDEQLTLGVKIRLEASGYQVVTAFNGRQALEQVGQQIPDLILLDVMMPLMDGYSCLRELNRRFGRSRIPVIIFTARDHMKDLFELEGIEDYVVKPFEHDDLLMRIDRALKRRASNASKGGSAK